MTLRRLAYALVPLLAAAPAVAQTAGESAAAGAKPGIVVTGHAQAQPLDPVQVAKQARAVTRDTDVRYEPLPRFEAKVCPGVIGLTQDAAEYVVGRIRMVAEDLHVPLAPNGKCSANVIVAFTDDGRADLAALQRRRNALARALTIDEQHELLEDPGPVRAFMITETRMQNGSLVPRADQLSTNAADLPVGRMEGGQSLISTGSHKEIVSVVVLFDREKVRPLTLQQVADYSVMRALAHTRDAKGRNSPDSILALFDGDNAAPPAGLTDFDRAYLQALYEGSPNVKGLSKLLRISHQLEKIEKRKE